MDFIPSWWERVQQASQIAVNITVIIAAIVALMKFKLFNVLGHRWRSELVCSHRSRRDGSIQFAADYIVHNTGSRTLRVKRVLLRLVAAKTKQQLLEPDDSSVLAERELVPKQRGIEGAFWIEGGERTIYSLYCSLRTPPENVFVICSFELQSCRLPSPFDAWYLKLKPPRPPSPFRELYSINPLLGMIVKGTPSQVTLSSMPPSVPPSSMAVGEDTAEPEEVTLGDEGNSHRPAP